MHPSEWVCVWCVEMRRASLLFIFFYSLYVHSNKSTSLNNYLLELTSLGESNNPSGPQLWGLCPPINKEGNPWHNCGDYFLDLQWRVNSMNLHYWISRSEHRGMTWLNYITDTSQNKHRGTIHKIYKWIHSEVTNTSTCWLLVLT